MNLHEADIFLTGLLDILRGGQNASGETHSEASKRIRENSSDVWCNQCYQRGYVSDEEKSFLIENNHIINDHIVRPILPEIRPFEILEMSELPDIEIQNTIEYVNVSRFCPKCAKDKFGSLSDWRE